jgi:hypothetical protein
MRVCVRRSFQRSSSLSTTDSDEACLIMSTDAFDLVGQINGPHGWVSLHRPDFIADGRGW